MPLENQVFTWENWDILDSTDQVFYSVELLVDVGTYKKG